MSQFLKNLLFVFFLLLISFYYNYHHIVFKPTQGIHQWRQTDGASFARNYYMEGMHFFKPKTHNLTSDGGKTSYTATADTPFLYYTVAILYKIFGYHEFIYRILNTLIYFIGLLYLFRLFMMLFKDFFFAVSFTFLAFCSPVLIYYASNFIPDSAALAIMFIALFHFFKYKLSGYRRHLIFMFIFFFISGSLKITALVSFFAIGFIFLLEWTGLTKFGKDKIFKHPTLFISGTIISLGLIFSWVLYASWYNNVHESSYFSTTIFPIWRIDKESVDSVYKGIRVNWIPEYYHYSIYILSGISLLLYGLLLRKIKPVFRIMIPILLLLGIFYFFLQFSLLKNHDYYLVTLYIIPIMLISGVFLSLRKMYPKFFDSIYMKTFLILLILFNIYYSEKKLEKRYLTDISKNEFYEITPYLRDLGLTRETKVISIPGRSHINLYLMDQKGWTEFVDHKMYKESFYAYNRDPEGILKSIENGAQYLILSNIDQLFEKPFLREFASHLAGKYKNVLIFDLNKKDKNFNLEERKTQFEIICDAEHLDSTGMFFLSSDSSSQFEFGRLQTDEFTFGGNHSVMLNKDNPYGMTIKFENIHQGESFHISVRKKGVDTLGSIVVSADNMNDFYLIQKNLSENNNPNSDWGLMEIDFFIPLQMEGKALKVFLFNRDSENVYFDDLKITKFESVLSD